MLAVSIVDKHHRELKRLCLIELLESQDTCSRLLASPDHVRNQIRIFCMHQVNEVTSIVNDDVRSDFEDPADMCFVFLRGRVIPCKNVQACMDESGSDIVLCRKRIASCHIHFSTAGCKDFTQIGCLCLEMH